MMTEEDARRRALELDILSSLAGLPMPSTLRQIAGVVSAMRILEIVCRNTSAGPTRDAAVAEAIGMLDRARMEARGLTLERETVSVARPSDMPTTGSDTKADA